MSFHIMGSQILRRKQVETLTGLSRSTLYAEIKAGRFPKQIQLTSKRCVGWLATDIDEYIAARVAASRKGAM
ncbi:AlpA family transcriptional regulator [Caballeronia sp. INSB1]|uniref:helix-turn-helix transcriptional regulator n=1 Tax=Caballeronia sp. INSB1 TaxID=2921751 RepID=UPI002032E382|nr:AlpA family phage regulatory protein [Caballeronia sp. INSB1]